MQKSAHPFHTKVALNMVWMCVCHLLCRWCLSVRGKAAATLCARLSVKLARSLKTRNERRAACSFGAVAFSSSPEYTTSSEGDLHGFTCWSKNCQCMSNRDELMSPLFHTFVLINCLLFNICSVVHMVFAWDTRLKQPETSDIRPYEIKLLNLGVTGDRDNEG